MIDELHVLQGSGGMEAKVEIYSSQEIAVPQEATEGVDDVADADVSRRGDLVVRSEPSRIWSGNLDELSTSKEPGPLEICDVLMGGARTPGGVAGARFAMDQKFIPANVHQQPILTIQDIRSLGVDAS
jgi:hypothetical protein